jgi:hypothetical protein
VFLNTLIKRLTNSSGVWDALAFTGGDSRRSAVLKSKIVQIQIDRPYAETYRIVSIPENFKLWSPLLQPRFEARGNNGRDWFADLPTGSAIIRFSEPNAYGVLDYTVIPDDGEKVRTTAVRLIPNGEVCELVLMFFMQPYQDDEMFASYVEWATTDFMTLKSVVETMVN